jgi:hypothetical protein
MTPENVRRRVVELLDSGRIPLRTPRSTSSGYGAGQTCAVCAATVDSGMRAIEAHGVDGVVRYYHEDCYSILLAERSRRSSGVGAGERGRPDRSPG